MVAPQNHFVDRADMVGMQGSQPLRVARACHRFGSEKRCRLPCTAATDKRGVPFYRRHDEIGIQRRPINSFAATMCPIKKRIGVD